MSAPTAPPPVGLRSRLFAGVAVGWTFENVADSLLMVIFAVWIADLTGNAGLAAATFAVFGAAALSAPFLGRITDMVSRRRMFIVLCMVGAASLVPLLFVTASWQFWWIYVASFVYAAAAYGTAGTRSGLLKDLLVDDDLGTANSILQSIDQVLRLSLPFIAAAAYAWVGPHLLIGVAIGCFVLAAAVFLFLRFAESTVEKEAEPFWRSVTAGFAFLGQHSALKRLSTAIVLVSCTLALTSAVGFAVLERIGVEPVWMGPIEAVSGIGGLIAGATSALLMTRLGRPRLVAIGIPIVGLGTIPLLGNNVWWFAAGLAIIGLGYTAVIIAYVTEVQVETPARLQGRVSTSANMLLQLPSVLVTSTGAALLGIIDARWIMAGALVVCAASFLAALGVRTGSATTRSTNASIPQ